MTWATLAAAVISALLLAAIDGGWPGRLTAIGGTAAPGISAPNGGAMGRQEAPARSKRERDERTRRDALQR